jgi:hypothetical protein
MQVFLFLALQPTVSCSSSSWQQHAGIPIPGSTADSFLFLLFLATTCKYSYSWLYSQQFPVPPLPGNNMQGFLFLAFQFPALLPLLVTEKAPDVVFPSAWWIVLRFIQH